MESKTLGQIAYEKFADEIGKTKVWHDLFPNQRQAFETIAQSVIEAHEARKWKPIESATDNLCIVWTKNNETTVAIRNIEKNEWLDMLGKSNDDGENLFRCDPTHWQPLPAPPKKGEE
ncbi:hypothetical protein DTO96_102431 [Ephemeroptericola cinctiostellae]|uniref:DUF551 domain-containing protein n=1 Tax=Ephemeroptericola cinctiostellae TaxID=2268024 RepID=A0A345DE88_9BURK|nr:DUF551 domain-containing protein [Ephemeroptericola cinctiostellae]AXF86676.1 hypothetical protein DTO96_102431 [Ephemeroptericola cinctiostellae]